MSEPRAPCADCRIDTEPMSAAGKALFKKWDFYILRGDVWAAAGMHGWASGFLCQKCLAKRLGRKLVDADFLTRTKSADAKGLHQWASPDYLTSPEFLLYGGIEPTNRTDRRTLERLRVLHRSDPTGSRLRKALVASTAAMPKKGDLP